MGTSMIFRWYNDLHQNLAGMSKEDLEKIDKLSPWSKEKESVQGWSILMELHNGNIEPLIWWKGRLLRLRDAPSVLTKKYYSKYDGKYLRSSEWTIFKKYLEGQLMQLDKEFKRLKRKEARLAKQS